MIVVRRGRPRDRVRQAHEMNEIVRALMSPLGATGPRDAGVWRPPLDVYETPEAITIVAEIAGMAREDIEVIIEGEIVSIRGSRPDPHVCDHRSFHEAHIAYGSFAADIYVPVGTDVERATASYDNGFLRIQLPRAQGRTIIPSAPATAADSDTRSNA